MRPRSNESADKRILIDINPYRTRAMLLENGIPVEFSMERRSKERIVGNIYKGKVQNVLPGMYAAFVNINEEKNAFLYAGDIKPDSSLLEGEQIEGKLTPSMICDIIKTGQDIMVQIVKEPMGTKGARASTQISLPGKTLVFLPTVDFIGISKRIANEAERKRLKQIVAELLPEGTGVIVRTAAEGLDEEMIAADLGSLVSEWEQINRRYREGKSPKLIHKEDSLVFRTVRDSFSPSVQELIVNDEKTYELISSLVDPGLSDRVKLYDGDIPLFEKYGSESAIDAALSRKVWLKSGAYIVIDQTEALTSIDVNTGKYVGNVSLGRTIAETNKEAAAEIARQLRLRDIGGIVIIDFIDMEDPHDREEVLASLNEHLRSDSTKSIVLGMTQLGLVEVTRKKFGANISSQLQQACPICGGTGKILSYETTAIRIREELVSRLKRDETLSGFEITAYPEVIKLLDEFSGEEISLEHRLALMKIVKKPDSSYHPEQYLIKNI